MKSKDKTEASIQLHAFLVFPCMIFNNLIVTGYEKYTVHCTSLVTFVQLSIKLDFNPMAAVKSPFRFTAVLGLSHDNICILTMRCKCEFFTQQADHYYLGRL